MGERSDEASAIYSTRLDELEAVEIAAVIMCPHGSFST